MTVLEATLAGDGALASLLGTGPRVWESHLNPGALYPSVVYDFPAGSPFRANRPQDSGFYQVMLRVHGQDCYPGALDSIVVRLQTLLEGAVGAMDNVFFIESGYRIRFARQGSDSAIETSKGLFSARMLTYAVAVGGDN